MGYNKVDPTEDMIQEILNKVDQNHSGHIKLHNKISFEKLVVLTSLYTLGIRAASQKNQSGISLSGVKTICDKMWPKLHQKAENAKIHPINYFESNTMKTTKFLQICQFPSEVCQT